MGLRIFLLSVRPVGAHSRGKDDPAEEFLRRCGRFLPADSRVFRTEAALLDWVRAEAKSGGMAFWMADPGGQSLTSEAFAERIRLLRDGGTRQLALAVGPADGWSKEARAMAELRVSLGAMTLPHEIARLVLAEQVYRASTILQGHPYHLGH